VYAIQLEQRDDVQKALYAARIGTGIHYPVPVHLQKAYANLGYGQGDLPVTEKLAERFLSLPIYAELRPEQVARVTQALEDTVLVEVV
jgi:dTDP-4-amino-4,6-dideoxygalactose transaminase